jgi:hypothetical protein
MRTHQEASENKSSAQNTFVPTANSLASRPFAVQAKPEESERSHETKGCENTLSDFSILNPEGGRSMPVQPKLAIRQPNDKYEQEGDRVARQVVQWMNAPQSPQLNQEPTVQRQEMLEDEEKLQRKLELTIQRKTTSEEEDELQMKPMLQLQAGEGSMAATSELESSIQRLRGSGQPLADTIRQPMEQAFRADFSGVKVHTDAQSDGLNQSIQAKAFTTGQDIFFRQGTYEPGSRDGQELLAHELTHVVQQSGGGLMRDNCSGALWVQRDIFLGSDNPMTVEEYIEKTKNSRDAKNYINRGGDYKALIQILDDTKWDSYKNFDNKVKKLLKEEAKKAMEQATKLKEEFTEQKQKEKGGSEHSWKKGNFLEELDWARNPVSYGIVTEVKTDKKGILFKRFIQGEDEKIVEDESEKFLAWNYALPLSEEKANEKYKLSLKKQSLKKWDEKSVNKDILELFNIWNLKEATKKARILEKIPKQTIKESHLNAIKFVQSYFQSKPIIQDRVVYIKDYVPVEEEKQEPEVVYNKTMALLKDADECHIELRKANSAGEKITRTLEVKFEKLHVECKWKLPQEEIISREKQREARYSQQPIEKLDFLSNIPEKNITSSPGGGVGWNDVQLDESINPESYIKTEALNFLKNNYEATWENFIKREFVGERVQNGTSLRVNKSGLASIGTTKSYLTKKIETLTAQAEYDKAHHEDTKVTEKNSKIDKYKQDLNELEKALEKRGYEFGTGKQKGANDALRIDQQYWEEFGQKPADNQIDIIKETMERLSPTNQIPYEKIEDKGESDTQPTLEKPNIISSIGKYKFQINSGHAYKYHSHNIKSHPGRAGTMKEVEYELIRDAIRRVKANALIQGGKLGEKTSNMIVINGVKIVYTAMPRRRNSRAMTDLTCSSK